MSAPDSAPAPDAPAPALSDLGYANGWREVPAIVLECQSHPSHFAYRSEALLNSSGTLHRCTCTLCRYTFLVDSSG